MTADQMAQVPFYLDWRFWSVTVSIVAIILSQIPPIHMLLRRAKLDIEAYSRMALTHKVGNPIAQMHLIISNAGGKEVKVKSIEMRFRRDTEDQFALSAQSYLQFPSDHDSVMLTSFKLKPNQEWAHILTFFNVFSRNEEKDYRQLEANLRLDILEKRRGLEDPNVTVAADEGHVQPLIRFFEEKFRWLPGEYELSLQVRAEPAKASVSKRYRFTLFESDSTELKDYCDDYKYGFGISLNTQRSSVFVPLTEA